MPNWDYWLGRKYDLMQQNANADTSRANAGMITANSGANLDTVRAGLLPQQTAADIAEAAARTRATNVNADLAPSLARSSINLNSANAYQSRQQGGLLGAQTSSESSLNGLVANPILQQFLQRFRLGM